MMHSQSQTRIHSPFAALLQKDIRLASQLMLVALIIVAAIAVIVTVLPLLGVVDVNDETPLLQNLLAVLFPTLFFMAIVMPAWIAVALTFGDAQRRGSMLVSMLPVASRTKWISKLIVLIACTMLFAALTISVWYAHPKLEPVTFKLIAWAIGIGLTAQLSGFATAAFTRSAVAAYAFQIGLLAAALITIIAFDWLVGRSALSLFTTSTAAIRVELGLGGTKAYCSKTGSAPTYISFKLDALSHSFSAHSSARGEGEVVWRGMKTQPAAAFEHSRGASP